MKNFSIKLMVWGCMWILISIVVFLSQGKCFQFWAAFASGIIFNLIGLVKSDKPNS